MDCELAGHDLFNGVDVCIRLVGHQYCSLNNMLVFRCIVYFSYHMVTNAIA